MRGSSSVQDASHKWKTTATVCLEESIIEIHDSMMDTGCEWTFHLRQIENISAKCGTHPNNCFGHAQGFEVHWMIIKKKLKRQEILCTLDPLWCKFCYFFFFFFESFVNIDKIHGFITLNKSKRCNQSSRITHSLQIQKSSNLFHHLKMLWSLFFLLPNVSVFLSTSVKLWTIRITLFKWSVCGRPSRLSCIQFINIWKNFFNLN